MIWVDAKFFGCVLLFAFLEAMFEGYAMITGSYSRRQTLAHRYAWLGRCFVVSVWAYEMYGFTGRAILMDVLACYLFWLAFELLLNWKRVKPIFYVGKNAWSDQQIRQLSLSLNAWSENKYFKKLKIRFTTTAEGICLFLKLSGGLLAAAIYLAVIP